MNSRKRHQMKKKIFALFGLFIPLFSFTFSYKGPYGDLILVTFSQIGARYGAIEELILWGIMSSLYYFSFLTYLFKMSGRINKILITFLSITCLTLLITVFLPYAPWMFPIVSRAHNFLAYVTASCIIFTILIFIVSLIKIDNLLFIKSLIAFIFTFSILLYTLLTYGVSSLFQIVLSTGMSIFMFVLLLFLEQSKKIDIIKNLNTQNLNDDENHNIF